MESSEAQDGTVHEGTHVKYTCKEGVKDGEEVTIQLTELYCATHGWIDPDKFSKNKRNSLYHNAVVHYCTIKQIPMKQKHSGISEHSNSCAECCQEKQASNPEKIRDVCGRTPSSDDGIPFTKAQLNKKRYKGRRCAYCLEHECELPELEPGQKYGEL